MGQPDIPEQILCTAKFCLMGSRKEYDVQLTRHSIRYLPSGTSAKWREILLDDIVGVHCMKGKSATDSKAYLSLFVYKRGRSLLTGSMDTVRQRNVLVFAVSDSHIFTENLHVADTWKSLIYRLSRPTGFPNPYCGIWLVAINPAGGQGKAERLFRERVVPIFAEADIPFEVIVSERAGHITEISQNLDLQKYSAMIIISGDGLIHEVFNGLMSRSDWQQASRLPLGIVPGGSGNALAASIHEACGEPYKTEFIKHSALLLTKSVPVPLDLLYLETATESRYAFLSVCWGLIADIDIESEKFRNLGETRFTVQALQRVADLRKYSGTLSYLPAAASGDTVPFRRNYQNEAILSKPCTDLLVPLHEPLPSDWITIEDDFIAVCLVTISRLATSTAGVPWAKLDDGLAYLFWIRAGAPKTAVASFLLNLGTGEHLQSSYVETVAVQAFRLEPKEKNGILTVDGELIQYGAIQGQVLPSLGTVLSRKNPVQ